MSKQQWKEKNNLFKIIIWKLDWLRNLGSLNIVNCFFVFCLQRRVELCSRMTSRKRILWICLQIKVSWQSEIVLNSKTFSSNLTTNYFSFAFIPIKFKEFLLLQFECLKLSLFSHFIASNCGWKNSTLSAKYRQLLEWSQRWSSKRWQPSWDEPKFGQKSAVPVETSAPKVPASVWMTSTNWNIKNTQKFHIVILSNFTWASKKLNDVGRKTTLE